MGEILAVEKVEMPLLQPQMTLPPLVLQRVRVKCVRVGLLPMRSLFSVVLPAFLSFFLVVAPIQAQNEARRDLYEAPGEPATPFGYRGQVPPPVLDEGAPALRESTREREVQRAAQRQQRRAQIEARLRGVMSDIGVQDATKQDALIAYLAEDEAGKITVRQAATRLLAAVQRGVEPQRMRDLMAVYKGAIDADKERRSAAQKTLDARIGYSLDPRLEATLWLFGFLGDGTPGLALNLPAPRPAPEDKKTQVEYGYASPVNRVAGQLPRRTGVVMGTAVAKNAAWIEVETADGSRERFLVPLTTSPRSVLDEIGQANLENLSRSVAKIPVGASVRVEWGWSEAKWATKIDFWESPTLIMKGATQNAPVEAPKENLPEPAPILPTEENLQP